MTEASLKDKTAKGLIWGGFSNGMQQLLNLLFGIFLARLLTPDDYGMVGMITVFSALAAALQEGGFISALTNRPQTEHRDYNAVFWFNLGCSLALYALLYACAPLIARFYHTPELTPLARLSFIGFVISSVNIAPRAYLFKHLRIKETTQITLTSLVVSGLVGITLAFHGWAYWGIVLQSITFVSTTTVMSYALSGWRPSLRFDFTPIGEMIGFSSKMILTNVFTILNNHLFSVLLGKFYSEHEVGNFTQANKWNSMGHATITGMINGIAQPVLTRVNNDQERQRAVFRKMLRFTAFISFPAMLGLSLIAKELIVITITEKWLASASILQLLCVWGAFIPLTTLFSNLLVSRGRSSVYLGSTVALCLAQTLAACCMHPYGLTWMLRIFIAIHVSWLFVWYTLAHREIGLKLSHLLSDITPYLGLSVILVTGAHYLTRPIDNLYLSLLVKVISVAGLYAFILWRIPQSIFRESLDYLRQKYL